MGAALKGKTLLPVCVYVCVCVCVGGGGGRGEGEFLPTTVAIYEKGGKYLYASVV